MDGWDARLEPASAETTAIAVRPQTESFCPPADIPTQLGPCGIRFDMNDGGRVKLPEGAWRVRWSDIDTGNGLFETRIGAGTVRTRKKYFCRLRLDVWDCGTEGTETSVLGHDYDAAGRAVLIQFPVGTLGDTIGWFPYAVKFRSHHGCQLTCAMAARLIPLFREAYPDIIFVGPDEVDPTRYYATYNIGLYFGDDNNGDHQPCDFRLVGLHRTAGYILGVDPTEERPMIAVPDRPRAIAAPYVVIATQSTTQAKYWNNPLGWKDVIADLKSRGLRVICIDQKQVHGGGIVWNHIPHGAEDQTGDRDLTERAHWIAHAEFFIGLSSGLSWLAWAIGKPVVMISGFTHPTNEFATPFRVINYHACNSCWNDTRIRFDHKDFLWCPRHAGTARQFECTRLITSVQVLAALAAIPPRSSVPLIDTPACTGIVTQ